MAENKRRIYYSDGGAAVDIYSNRFQQNTAPQPAERPAELPAELPRERRAPKQKVRARLELSPMAILGVLGTALLLTMVIFAYVRLYEQKSLAGALNNQLSALQEETAKLRSGYENSINLEAVEQQAKAMGMRQPASNQTVYLSIPAEDKAQVLAGTQSNIFTQTWSALREGFTGILEYFS